jgi:hypothetical protein
MIRITSKLAMAVFDSYKKNNNLTTHQPLPGSPSTILKFWTKSLVFTCEGKSVYSVDAKKKAEHLSALPLFEEWVNTNNPKEIV